MGRYDETVNTTFLLNLFCSNTILAGLTENDLFKEKLDLASFSEVQACKAKVLPTMIISLIDLHCMTLVLKPKPKPKAQIR